MAKQKQRGLDARFEKNPERFVKGRPNIKLPPEFVAINGEGNSTISDCVNFPTLTAAGYVGNK